jgi:hypothetical protein
MDDWRGPQQRSAAASPPARPLAAIRAQPGQPAWPARLRRCLPGAALKLPGSLDGVLNGAGAAAGDTGEDHHVLAVPARNAERSQEPPQYRVPVPVVEPGAKRHAAAIQLARDQPAMATPLRQPLPPGAAHPGQGPRPGRPRRRSPPGSSSPIPRIATPGARTHRPADPPTDDQGPRQNQEQPAQRPAQPTTTRQPRNPSSSRPPAHRTGRTQTTTRAATHHNHRQIRRAH